MVMEKYNEYAKLKAREIMEKYNEYAKLKAREIMKYCDSTTDADYVANLIRVYIEMAVIQILEEAQQKTQAGGKTP